MTTTNDVSRSLRTLLHEVLDGPAETAAFVLNRGDLGLLASLDEISAADASVRPADGGTSVAAHVDHLRYGLELLNRWARGEDPWSTAHYAASWQRTDVDEAQWRARRDALKQEARIWTASVTDRVEWNELSITEAFSSVVHLAYHLGAIRQIARATRGPRARD
jgi:hypothetical protein